MVGLEGMVGSELAEWGEKGLLVVEVPEESSLEGQGEPATELERGAVEEGVEGVEGADSVAAVVDRGLSGAESAGLFRQPTWRPSMEHTSIGAPSKCHPPPSHVLPPRPATWRRHSLSPQASHSLASPLPTLQAPPVAQQSASVQGRALPCGLRPLDAAERLPGPGQVLVIEWGSAEHQAVHANASVCPPAQPQPQPRPQLHASASRLHLEASSAQQRVEVPHGTKPTSVLSTGGFPDTPISPEIGLGSDLCDSRVSGSTHGPWQFPGPQAPWDRTAGVRSSGEALGSAAVEPTVASVSPSGQSSREMKEEAELRVLESKLELLQVQRELCAVKCQVFLEYLEHEVERERVLARYRSFEGSDARAQIRSSNSSDYVRSRKGKRSHSTTLRRHSRSLPKQTLETSHEQSRFV